MELSVSRSALSFSRMRSYAEVLYRSQPAPNWTGRMLFPETPFHRHEESRVALQLSGNAGTVGFDGKKGAATG